MLRKFLKAALAAAMVFALSTGAFGADVYYTGGGGGGGGGGDSVVTNAKDGGKGGSAVSGVDIANRGDTAASASGEEVIGGDGGSGTAGGDLEPARQQMPRAASAVEVRAARTLSVPVSIMTALQTPFIFWAVPVAMPALAATYSVAA